MSLPTTPDLSVVILADDHIPTMHGCVHSVERSVHWARAAGFSVACSILLKDDQKRAAGWAQQALNGEWAEISFHGRGTGAMRSAALAATDGRYVAFIDASDLWSANWLLAALRGVIAEGGIWRPEVLITYGGDHFSTEGYTLRLFTEADGEIDALLGSHTLPTGFLCSRDVLEAVPIPKEDAARGWGEVDWWWNCSAAMAGFRHRIMPGTFHYRRLSWSTLTQGLRDPRTRPRFGPIPLA